MFKQFAFKLKEGNNNMFHKVPNSREVDLDTGIRWREHIKNRFRLRLCILICKHRTSRTGISIYIYIYTCLYSNMHIRRHIYIYIYAKIEHTKMVSLPPSSRRSPDPGP